MKKKASGLSGWDAQDEAEFRRLADERLAQRGPDARPPSEGETARLLHELQVHQVELEMQNEELRLSRTAVEAGLEAYTDLYDFAPVSYFTLAADGSICQANLTGASLLGVDRARLVGRFLWQFVPENERPALGRFLRKVFARQPWETCEVTLGQEQKLNLSSPGVHFDPASLHILQIHAALAADGNTCRIVAVDISARKRLEKELLRQSMLLELQVEQRTNDLRLANENLLRSARIKDEFLASMSHELRTPLTTILGFSEALQMQVYGELNPKQSESVGNIEKSGRNLLALINDILDLSRASAGMIVVEPEVVSVRELCRACLRLVRPASQEKQIEVEISIEEGVDEIQVDQQRMKQILVNLLNNAVKFSTRGSQVGLDVCGDAHNRRILFCVWDNGIGISPDDLSRLFLPFTQLDSALSRRYGGTGLGLSLVLKLVELLGGGVSVSSTPGEGSRFTVTLPWDSRLSPQENNPAPEILPAAHFTHRPSAPLVLIVEDNLLYLDLLSDILAHHGCRVIQAVNGEEGISRARENHPDLILMDIQMPVMDGYQAASSIRANPELARIPIIALTALAMNGDREKCVRAGMNDYLSKPVNTADLFRAMYALLDH